MSKNRSLVRFKSKFFVLGLVRFRLHFKNLVRFGSQNSELVATLIWIYVFILMISFLESIRFSLTFVGFDENLVWYLNEKKVYFIFYFIEGKFYDVTKSSISPLLLLTAFIIRQKLNGMKIVEFISSPYSKNSVVFY